MTRVMHRWLWVLHALMAWVMALGTAEAATLRLGGALAQPGEVNVAIALTLEPEAGEAVASLQCDVPLDGAVFRSVRVAQGQAAEEAQKDVRLSEPLPGTWRIIVSGFNQNIIGAGEVAILLLDIAVDAEERAYLVPLENAVLASTAGQRVDVVPRNGAVYVGEGRYHDADTSQDNRVLLPELLRLIQFFNSGQYHCDPAGEDGFNPGPGPQDCPFHDSDFAIPRNWSVSLSELLRLIQFFNSGGYIASPGTEDGFAPEAGRGASIR